MKQKCWNLSKPALIPIDEPAFRTLMMLTDHPNYTRMTGLDQIVWNLSKEDNLFCIWGIASLAEPLKDDLIRDSLKHLIKIIPILHAKPITNWWSGKWQFVEKENVDDLIVRITTETEEETEAQLKNVFLNPIDPKQCAMIRVISIDGPAKNYFVIQVHHLVVDGEGVKRICVKFAEIYQELYRDKDWQPAKMLDPNRSWWQIARKFTCHHYWLIAQSYVTNAYRLFAFIIGKKAKSKIAGDSTGKNNGDTRSLYYESVQIEQESMVKLKAFTKRKNVTVNDVLMTSFALAAKQWNGEHGDNRDWVEFAYTANMRRWWGEPKGPFANMSAIQMHEEICENLRDPSVALAKTKAKIDKNKKIIGLDVFFTLLQLKCIPYGIIRWFSLGFIEKLYGFLSNNHGMTNIGIVFEEAGDFGHTKALGYSLLAPTFPGGCIIYTVTTYKNVTTIHLGTSEDFLTKQSAKRFLLLWKQMILRVSSQEEQ